MKRIELFHPRVFADQTWADGYYKRNAKNIERVGRRLTAELAAAGFREGRVLDAGCGFGAVAIELAKKFPQAQITGIDLADPLLEMARRFAANTGLSRIPEFIRGDVIKTDFPDNHFDVVISSFMLHIVEDPVQMLNEIQRIAKPNAVILITDLRRIWLGHLVKKLRTAYTLNEALEVIGHSNLKAGRSGKGPFWWDYFAGITKS
ncbi:MAG: class I SAM-dependent methyltransferase [Bacteroidales bacterium]